MKINEELKKAGAVRVNGHWRIPIFAHPPLVLTKQEEEWNRRGGRPLGRNAIEALNRMHDLWPA